LGRRNKPGSGKATPQKEKGRTQANQKVETKKVLRQKKKSWRELIWEYCAKKEQGKGWKKKRGRRKQPTKNAQQEKKKAYQRKGGSNVPKGQIQKSRRGGRKPEKKVPGKKSPGEIRKKTRTN